MSASLALCFYLVAAALQPVALNRRRQWKWKQNWKKKKRKEKERKWEGKRKRKKKSLVVGWADLLLLMLLLFLIRVLVFCLCCKCCCRSFLGGQLANDNYHWSDVFVYWRCWGNAIDWPIAWVVCVCVLNGAIDLGTRSQFLFPFSRLSFTNEL